MAFINVFIENTCKISIENERLILEGENKIAVYPVADINCVLIDCLTINISTYALNKLCESGATVIVCDKKHLPSCVMLPFDGYYRRFSVLKEQTEISKVKLKALWQSIIKQKLFVQGQCLEQNSKEGSKYLYTLSKSVLSGDSAFAESKGAAFYFKQLFGKDFSRTGENSINAFLNYAYTINRYLICRHLSARGFECAIGIFHKNQFNAFNLADDIIEPFRPIIDNYVYNIYSKFKMFDSSAKKAIFSVVNLNVLIDNEKHSLTNAVEKMVESLLSVYLGKKEKLLMPFLIEISMHEYE